MTNKSLVLVVNPGSSSRKYGLYNSGEELATINFEFVDGKVFSKLKFKDQKIEKNYEDKDLSVVSGYVLPALKEAGVISEDDKIEAVGLRLVAPSKLFSQDQLVNDEIEAALDSIQKRAPLHVTTVIAEIKQLRGFLKDTPIIVISDSAFHSSKPDYATYYGIDTEFADKIDVKKYCFHGISVGSVVGILKKGDKLASKTIICHLGSGSSISAVIDGKSVDNTMGYTPLEGLMMATRCGDMDISAALAIKRALNLEDEELEEYLNKKSGLIGVSGSSNDIRQLLVSEEQGDARAKLALDMFIYRIRQAIGKMVASMGGADSIVFTATIGERSAPIRSRVLDGLGYLGFDYDKELNEKTFEPKEIVDLSTNPDKTVLVVSTDEAAEIANRADIYVKNM